MTKPIIWAWVMITTALIALSAGLTTFVATDRGQKCETAAVGCGPGLLINASWDAALIWGCAFVAATAMFVTTLIVKRFHR